MSQESYRIQHKFWLDIAKEEEYLLAEKLAKRKTKREYTATLRNALRLYFSLQTGATHILDEMFPFVQQQYKSDHTSTNTISDGVSKSDFERLEHLLASLTMSETRLQSMHATASESGPKSMTVPQFELPRFDEDDDDFTLELQPVKDTNATQNFINAMNALQ